MAATFEFDESNGAGETVTHGRTEANWKNIDDSTTAYTSNPITAGNNSFEKWVSGHFSGTYSTIQAGLWAHTAGAMGTGLTIKGQAAMTTDTDKEAYTTPAVATNAALTFDDTAVTAIASGRAVWFGATSPTGTKTASTTANPAYTNYLVNQLQTTTSAAAGDTTSATWTLRFDEN